MEDAQGRLFSDPSEDEGLLKATLWQHLNALRATLISILYTLGAGIALSLLFYPTLLDWVAMPLIPVNNHIAIYEIKQQQIVNRGNSTLDFTLPASDFSVLSASPEVVQHSPTSFSLPAGSSLQVAIYQSPTSLNLFTPFEGMHTMLKICFWTGLVASSPFWLYLSAKFIAPALTFNERKLFAPFMVLSVIFMGAGALFAYLVTIPLANQLLSSFNATIGTNLWSFGAYVDYTLLLMLASCLAFEIALLLFFLVHIGWITPDWMKKKRRQMILAAFIVGAILTPPDVLTQIMLALPLIGLYELALLYGRLRQPALSSVHID